MKSFRRVGIQYKRPYPAEISSIDFDGSYIFTSHCSHFDFRVQLQLILMHPCENMKI